MYKLVLCLRYLWKRLIAYFAMLAVALCVAMVLIVASVMNGFLQKMENAAKGLFGDVMVRATSLGGLGYYDEFIEEIKSAKLVPPGGGEPIAIVHAASPFISTFGILQVPDTEYRQAVEIAGIRLPERADVTDFEDGLWAQAGRDRPDFDPPIELLMRRLADEQDATLGILERITDQGAEGDGEGDEDRLTPRQLRNALGFQSRGAALLAVTAPHQKAMADLQARIDAARKRLGADGDDPELLELERKCQELVEVTGYGSPPNRIILGLGLPALSFRTPDGETVRVIVPGLKVTLTLIPLGGEFSMTDITPSTRTFTVVDDSRTDVAPIDSKTVYVPLETLQQLNNMAAEYAADDPTQVVVPARCSMIHIRAADAFAGSEGQLRRVAAAIQNLWADFHARHPDAALGDVSVQTWRQMQAKFIAPIEQQRTLVLIMFGIISLTAVVLIFVIFYMIVLQKTRDIGVLKAIGAGSGGVAGIFLAYGGIVGLAGSIVGAVGGWLFVLRINEIADALDRWFGFRPYSKETFLFEKIPNQVDPATVLWIVLGAIMAGVIGALLPAMKAARMQPVEALRYE